MEKDAHQIHTSSFTSPIYLDCIDEDVDAVGVNP